MALGTDMISLQDMCKLYLLATIDEYPVDVLAKLPLHMRKKLFMAMPVIDRLHFVGTVFLDGLEIKHNVAVPDHNQLDLCSDPLYGKYTSDSNEVYLCPWLTRDDLEQGMADILILPVKKPSLKDCSIKRFCALNFPEGCFDSFRAIIPLVGFDSGTFNCVKSYCLTMCNEEYDHHGMKITHIIHIDKVMTPSVINDAYCENCIIPSRLSRFIRNMDEFRLYYWEYEFESTHFEAFVEYCQLWSWIPKVLKINSNKTLLESPLWKYFLTRHTQPDGGCVVFLYLMKLLSPVETLQLSSPWNDTDVSMLRELIFPIIRLCAGHNMESRSLKHIEINSRSLEDAIDILIIVEEFLSGKNHSGTTAASKDDGVPPNEPSPIPPLDFHCNKPYLIESLSIIVETKAKHNRSERELQMEARSRSLMEGLEAILRQQMDSLKHVTVKLLIKIEELNVRGNQLSRSSSSFWKPHTIHTLVPTLIDFVRQPQFQSLALNVLTSDLYHAFITTPAIHDQLLAIDSSVWEEPKPSGRPHIVPVDQPHLSHWPHINPSDIPFSNLKFKSLDLGSFDSQWNKEAMAASPILRLNMLHIPFDSLLSVREDAIVEVSHVKIDFTESKYWTHDVLTNYKQISSVFQKNQYLSSLELFPRKLPTIPFVNHCLELLIQPSLPVSLHDSRSQHKHYHDNVDKHLKKSIHILVHHSFLTFSTPALSQQTLEEIHLHLDTPLLSYILFSGLIPRCDLSMNELNQQIKKYNLILLNLFALIRVLGESRVTQRLVITADDKRSVDFQVTPVRRQLLQRIIEQSGDGRVKQIILKGYSAEDNLSEDLKTFELIADEVVVDS